MNPSTNLVFIGPTGAGKTSLGRRVAERFGLSFIDLDVLIAEQAGSSIATLFEHAGEAGFREHESRALAQALQGERVLVATGAGAVLDAANRKLIASRAFVVHLHVSVGAQLTRLARDRSRPLLQRSDRDQVLAQMAAVRDPLYRDLAELSLDTDRFVPAEATAQLVLQLAARWQQLLQASPHDPTDP